MTVLDFLLHQWKQWWRSATWKRSLLATSFLILGGIYFTILSVAAGWFYPKIVEVLPTDRHPIRLLDAYALHAFGGLSVARFFLQRAATKTAKPYLKLPISQTRLTRILQVTSTLNLFNLLPIALLVSLWGSTVFPVAHTSGAVLWGSGALALLLTSHFANSFFRVIWNRNAGLLIGVACASAVAAYLSALPDFLSVKTASEWLFSGLRESQTYPIIVTGFLAAGSTLISHWSIRSHLRILLESNPRNQQPLFKLSLHRDLFNVSLFPLILLNFKLIFRNKRPRQMLFSGIPFVSAFFFILANNPAPVNMIMFSFIVSGYIGITYTQFSYSWHGSHFEKLISQPSSSHSLALSQFFTFSLLCIINFTIISPFFYFLNLETFFSLISLLIYNLGITSLLLITLGVFLRKPLSINESTFFNYQGVSYFNFLTFSIPLFPPVLSVLLFSITEALAILAGLGVTGLCLSPLWIRGIGNLLRRQRHVMVEAF